MCRPLTKNKTSISLDSKFSIFLGFKDYVIAKYWEKIEKRRLKRKPLNSQKKKRQIKNDPSKENLAHHSIMGMLHGLYHWRNMMRDAVLQPFWQFLAKHLIRTRCVAVGDPGQGWCYSSQTIMNKLPPSSIASLVAQMESGFSQSYTPLSASLLNATSRPGTVY